MRLFLGLAGFITLFTALGRLRELDWDFDFPARSLLAIYVPLFVALVLSVAFIIAAVRLPAALLHGAVWVQRMLIAAALAVLLEAALAHAVSAELAERAIAAIALRILLVIYLLRSVRRLAREARARAAIPDVPTARVAR